MNIYGKKVVLRAMELEDCELVRGMFNDPEIEAMVTGWAFPISRFAQEQWYRTHYNDTDNYRFVIESLDGTALGIATLTNIDWKNRCALHGMKLARRNDGHKGFGTDTVMAIMRYAFDELQLHRLNGSWFSYNIPSKSMYMKCGWKEEGIQRECVFKGGKYRDIIITGILESDYRELINKNHYWD